MDEKIKKDLQKIACKVRMGVIEGYLQRKVGSPGRLALDKRYADIPLLQ